MTELSLRESVLARIRAGYLLHYGRDSTLASEDPDLALLEGDRMYALGLSELARRGDVASVREFADLISLAVTAHVRGEDSVAERAFSEVL